MYGFTYFQKYLSSSLPDTSLLKKVKDPLSKFLLKHPFQNNLLTVLWNLYQFEPGINILIISAGQILPEAVSEGGGKPELIGFRKR
jgi:hypothetical protein